MTAATSLSRLEPNAPRAYFDYAQLLLSSLSALLAISQLLKQQFRLSPGRRAGSRSQNARTGASARGAGAPKRNYLATRKTKHKEGCISLIGFIALCQSRSSKTKRGILRHPASVLAPESALGSLPSVGPIEIGQNRKEP